MDGNDLKLGVLAMRMQKERRAVESTRKKTEDVLRNVKQTRPNDSDNRMSAYSSERTNSSMPDARTGM